MSEHNKSNKITLPYIFRLLLSAIIPIIIITISFYLGGFEPFGNKNVITASKTPEELFRYYEMYDHFKNDITDNYSNTLGTLHEYYSDHMFYLSDPTNLIILLVSRDYIPKVINILYIFKMSLCSLFFSIFLSNKTSIFITNNANRDNNTLNKKKDKKSIILGGNDNPDTGLKRFLLNLNPIIIALSVSFALSGYFISEGYNINYLLSIAMLPLIALGIDRLIYSNKNKLLIISFSISIISNVYISLINILLVTVYFFIESGERNESIIKLFEKYLLNVLISIALSSFVFIPVVAGNTFQNIIDLSFVRYEKTNNLWNVISQFMFKYSPSSLSWSDCGVNLYMGILGIILATTFIFNKSFRLSYRIKYGLFIILLFLSLIISNINYLFNGFRGFINNTYIYGYFIIFLILTLAYSSFSSINSINKLIFTIFAIILSVIIIITMKKAENLVSIKPLFYSLEILFAYYFIIIIRLDNSMTKILFNLLLSVICIFEITATYIPNTSILGANAFIRPTTDSTEYKLYEACRYVHDINPDATILALDSTTNDTTPFNLAIEGYDYVITRENNYMVDPILEYITTIRNEGMLVGVSIYKNPYSIHSTYVKNNADSFIYNPKHSFASANIFSSQYMNADSIFEITEGTARSIRSYNDRSETFYYSVNSSGEAYIKTYKTDYIGNNSSKNEYSAIYNIPVDRFDNYTTEFAILDYDAYYRFINICKDSNNNISLIPKKDSVISSTDSGSIILPIQNSSCLSVYNNSRKIKTKSIMQDCVLLSIEKGDNRISIDYSIKYIIGGLIISMLSILLMIIKHYANTKNSIKQMIQKLNMFIRSNSVYVITFLILTLIFLIAQIITGSGLFGAKSIIRDDALSQSFVYYVEKVKMIKNGTPFSWISHNIGLTRDITLSSLTATPVHPWNYILYRYLPESMYMFDFTLEFYTIYILNAFTIIYYLSHRKYNSISKNERKLILLGTAYGLSTYAIVLFQYECFRFLLYTPLVILGIEKIIYENKKCLYIIALSLMMLNDAYYAFILCEWIILIFLTYKFENIKHFIKSVYRLGIASIASAGITAFRLLPYFFMTRGSGYKVNDMSKTPSIIDSFTDVITLLSEYRPFNYMRTMTEQNYRSASYIGMSILIILPLYAINKKIHPAQRIKNLLLVLLIYISFNNQLLNYIFHGMHYQVLVPNRFAAILVFLLVCTTADVLIHYKEYKTVHLLLFSTLITILYTTLHILNHDILSFSPKLGLIILIIISVIQIANALSEEKQKDIKQVCYKMTCIVMLLDIISNSLYLFSVNIGSQSSILTEASYINNLTSHYNDLTRPFTGSVYLNGKDQNIACMTDIESPEFFSSGISSETLDLYNKYNIHNSLNTSYYGTGNPLADMMMHTKYHIEDSYQDSHSTWYPFVKAVNNLNVYENPYNLPLGFVIADEYDTNLNKWDNIPTNEYKNVFEYQNAFTKAFVSDKLFEAIDIKEINFNYKHKSLYEMYDPNNLMNSGEIESTTKTQKSYFYINNINTSSYEKTSYSIPITIHINTSKLSSGSYYACINDYIMYLCDITEDDINKNVSLDMNIDIPSESTPKISELRESFSIAKLNKDVMSSAHNTLSESILTDITTNGRNISAEINVKNSGRLYFGLPYSNYWKLYIDGKRITLSQYLGGMGATISNGKHVIVLKYYPKGLFEGIAISIISITLVILVYIITNKKLKKKQ